MVYLVLTILLSCAISALFYAVESRDGDGDSIMLLNYLWASAITLVLVIQRGQAAQLFGRAEIAAFSANTGAAIKNAHAALLGLGLCSGLCMFLHVAVSRRSNFENGTGMGGVFTKGSFLIPLVLGIFLWSRKIDLKQALGTLMTIAALVMMIGKREERGRIHRPGLLIWIFLAAGFMSLSYEAFVVCGMSGMLAEAYFFVTFSFGAVLSLIHILALRRSRVRLRFGRIEFLGGLAIGSVNALFNLLTLKCMQVLPGAVYYPTNAAGSLIMSLVVGCALFHEKLTRRQWFAAAVTAVSIVLVNLGG